MMKTCNFLPGNAVGIVEALDNFRTLDVGTAVDVEASLLVEFLLVRRDLLPVSCHACDSNVGTALIHPAYVTIIA
jgi:hypothetical protein